MRKKHTRLLKNTLIILILVIVITNLIIFTSRYQPEVIKDPRQGNLTGLDSTNWAGYVAETNFDSPEMNSVDSVSAYWNVSDVKCSSYSQDYVSSFWVGIGGFSSRSIEQIGTDSDCIQNTPVYYAWYEIYPKPIRLLDISINPGDKIRAEVNHLEGDNFQLSLTNIKTGENFTTIQKNPTALRLSAEIITEAPLSMDRSILPLSNFGPVNFYNTTIKIDNISGPIDYKYWEHQGIIMVDSLGRIKATPTQLSSDGKNFSVLWEMSR